MVELKGLRGRVLGKRPGGPDRVVGELPAAERPVHAGQVQFAVAQLVKLFVMGGTGSLDATVQFGRAWWQDVEPDAAVGAGPLEIGLELSLVVVAHLKEGLDALFPLVDPSQMCLSLPRLTLLWRPRPLAIAGFAPMG